LKADCATARVGLPEDKGSRTLRQPRGSVTPRARLW
jgi:hypothetical protein